MKGNELYPHLFEPLQIKSLYLKNRFIEAPMGTFSEEVNGYPSYQQIEYYRTRARGGFSLIIPEAQFVVSKTEAWIAHQTIVGTADQMHGWLAISEAVHSEGAKIMWELGCGLGREAPVFVGNGTSSASANPLFYNPSVLAHALTTEEVHEIIEGYRIAAKHVLEAGGDAIEIHAHYGYMLDQFMTPIWNHRDDEYGGSFENRMRIVKEAYEAVREVVGPNFPIFIRMAAYHDFEGGRTMEESKEIVRYLDELGIDAFDIDLGCYDSGRWLTPSIYTGEDSMLEAAAEFRTVTDKPIFNAGMHTPESAEKALADGKIDAPMFGRASIADPDLPNKIWEGRRDDVRPCLACNTYCSGHLVVNKPISCAVNAEANYEFEYKITQTKDPKKVVVIGGGPGGMEAARVAKLSGHDVTLYEKSDRLGGTMLPAMEPCFKERLRRYNKWQIEQLEKLGVPVVFNKALDADSPELKDADRIIVAIGATPAKVPIKGIDGENVVNVIDYHNDTSKLHGDKIVVCGGGASGCDCALELAMQGKDVTIAEMLDAVVPAMVSYTREPLLYELNKYNVKIMTKTKIKEITADGVHVDTEDGEQFLPADMVIDAFGMRARRDEANAIFQKYGHIATIIGDCDHAAQIGEAVRGGYFAAWSIH